MELSITSLRDLVMLSLREPRAAARHLLDLGLGRDVLWTALALVVTLSAISFYLTNVTLTQEVMPTPEPPGGGLGPMFVQRMSPAIVTLMFFGNMVLLVFGLYWTGKVLGGVASLPDMILVLSWVQFLMLVLQVAQTVLMLLAPLVAALFTFAALIYLMWVFLVFLAEAEGFSNLPRAVIQVLLTLVGVSVGLGLILSLIGVSAQGAIANV